LLRQFALSCVKVGYSGADVAFGNLVVLLLSHY
jgi:hypothetical protein